MDVVYAPCKFQSWRNFYLYGSRFWYLYKSMICLYFFNCPSCKVWSFAVSSISNFCICSVAHFLESRGMIEEALEVATDPEYRFELAIQLGRLEVAKVKST